jgi:hypothetical protein
LVRLGFTALLASVALFWPSRADAATVMIVRPAEPSAEITETVSRLHGELLAVGLAVTIAERPEGGGSDGTSARAWLNSAAIDRGIAGAIDVIGDVQVEGADIWVFQQAPHEPEITRVLAERDVEDAPARLAIRAIDVLRSRLIERELGGVARPAAPATAAPPAAHAADAPAVTAGGGSAALAGTWLGAELGVAVLASLDGVGPAILPVFRIEAALGPRIGIQGEAAAFGTRPTVGTPGASARVAQQYALLGACLCAPSAARWRSIVGFSAGALRTTAEGEADAPLQGHAVAQWSFLLEASAGLRLRLAQRTHLTLAAHVQVAEPYVDIRVVNAGSATAGRPNLLLTLALGGWL